MDMKRSENNKWCAGLDGRVVGMSGNRGSKDQPDGSEANGRLMQCAVFAVRAQVSGSAGGAGCGIRLAA